MRLAAYQFEWTGPAVKVRLTFERNARLVDKWMMVSDEGESKEELRKQLIWACSKKAKEADRDLAYQVFGEEWRDHCEYPLRGFWDVLPQAEQMFSPVVNGIFPTHVH